MATLTPQEPDEGQTHPHKWGEDYSLPIPAGGIIVGENIISICSGIIDGDDLDDFQFKNLKVTGLFQSGN